MYVHERPRDETGHFSGFPISLEGIGFFISSSIITFNIVTFYSQGVFNILKCQNLYV